MILTDLTAQGVQPPVSDSRVRAAVYERLPHLARLHEGDHPGLWKNDFPR
jgi:hypothetical protein